MADVPAASPDDAEPDTADASWLVGEPAAGPASASSPPATAAESPAAPSDGYDLDGDEPPVEEPVAPVPIIPPVLPKPKPQPHPQPREELEEEPEVDPVWSRWGEWGPDLIRLFLAALGTFVLLALVAMAGWYTLAFIVFLGGAAGALVLAYPILITLERPVRVTPEQAVRDYFAALSHLRPSYRRMWLLLSSSGKSADPFDDEYLEFQAYWEGILASWNPTPQRFSPWRFEVIDFTSEKSAGQTVLDVKFTVQAKTQSDDPSTPPKSFLIKARLVKGPDRMWYLNRGTLPQEAPATS